MSEQSSDTGAVTNGPDEKAHIPLAPDETEAEPGSPEEPEGPEPGEESGEEQPQGEAAEAAEADLPTGHLKINLTIGEGGRTTVGIKRHDTDLVMTTIFASEPEEVLRQVPGLIGRAEARWTLEKMNPAYNRNPNKAKITSKAKTQTNQNRSRPNPVSAPARQQTSSEATPPPEAQVPAETQAEPLRLF